MDFEAKWKQNKRQIEFPPTKVAGGNSESKPRDAHRVVMSKLCLKASKVEANFTQNHEI